MHRILSRAVVKYFLFYRNLKKKCDRRPIQHRPIQRRPNYVDCPLILSILFLYLSLICRISKRASDVFINLLQTYTQRQPLELSTILKTSSHIFVCCPFAYSIPCNKEFINEELIVSSWTVYKTAD